VGVCSVRVGAGISFGVGMGMHGGSNEAGLVQQK